MANKQQKVKDKTVFLTRRPNAYVSWISVVVVLGLWETAAWSGLVPPLFLPRFTEVLTSGYELFTSGEIFVHVGASLWRIGWGFFLGAGAGVVLGVMLGYFQLLDDMARPLVAATYPIPKIAILPLLILWLGIGEGAKVAVIMLGVFFPVVINVRAGVRNVDPLLIKAALSLGSGPFNVIRKVILPMSLPMIFAGLRLGLGIALLLVVTAEMIAADKGIGFLILSSADLMQTRRLLFGIMMLSAMGISFAWILEKLERILIPWQR